MLGNVRQWCEDCYDMDYYQSSPLKDPTGPLSVSNLQQRVARGSNWYSPGTDSRSAFRLSHLPTGRATNRGFRVVLLLESPGDVRP
jgi:formylglycine-generating enzyme required for sulfatase activity